MGDVERYVVDIGGLPTKYPTHRHAAVFWEALGRAVATFGFLENVLGRAIFAFTATRPYSDEVALNAAYEGWLSKLEGALRDPLKGLIQTYGKAVRDHPGATLDGLPELLRDLEDCASLRNVICHGFWNAPDDQGRSLPQFFDKSLRRFETPIDVVYLDQLQSATAALACMVMNTVTHMGWRFPGAAGEGKPIL